MPTLRQFGDIPGVAPGALFADRRALAAAGVHRPIVAGISGGEDEGADSIVLSGGYEDDEDYGNVLVYTGHGGNDPSTGKQISDQAMHFGNRALAKSADEGLPVRVSRGAQHRSPYSPSVGYAYAGLFYVDSYWRQRGRSGHWIWRFRLVQDRSEGPPGDEALLVPIGGTASQRREVTTQRLIRSTQVAKYVKDLHRHECQICGVTLETSAGLYGEAAHIRPLGRPHDGPDEPENVLCLCPNHHVLFDRGGLIVEDDFRVRNAHTGAEVGVLRVNPRHRINKTHLAYHRGLFPHET